METKIQETAGDPQTVDEARHAVEKSRQRISSTLDALEDRIVEKKHEIRERVDVLRPVRDQIAVRPFTAVAVAAGVGALLGSLGGSDDDEHRHSRSGRVRGRALSDDDRSELREWRKARRERLRARISTDHDEDDDGRDTSRFDALKHQLMGAVTTAVTTAVTKRVRRMAMDNINGLIGGDDGARQREGHRGSLDETRWS
jgi:ElaB/YqjD/DUF883 family membrane-anchored ribosome-binding protein